jgi:soluble cytochrome b562
LHYLRYLAQRPGVEVGALQLSAAVAGHAGVVLPDSDAGEVVDDQALAMYRDRLREIDGDLAEAESWADQGRVERLRREREALLDEVSSATGLAGRRRRVGSTNERARVAVRKAIAATLDRVERQDPALGRLLRDTVITGTTCRYDPDPARPVTWVFDRSGR